MKESRLDLKKRRIREFFSTFKLKPKEKEEDIDKIQEKVWFIFK